jgi:hypothetical protein
MNKRSTPQSGRMDELQQELFGKQLLSISKGLDYPRTPDIAGSVMTRLRGATRPRFISRRLVWSLTVILILFSSLMLIPPARAAIIEFIQIGVVRIFRAEPTPLAPPNQEIPSTVVPVTATPVPTSQPLIPILENLAGEMTLDEAQKAVNYPILLPSYPPDVGKPDRIFVQDADGKMTVLVWLDPQHPDQILMSLHFLPAGSWAIKKIEPTHIQETTVNSQRAIWAIGPYPLRLSNGDLDFVRLIDGHVLIWEQGDITYRLETDLSLEEAVKIAESLQPIEP